MGGGEGRGKGGRKRDGSMRTRVCARVAVFERNATTEACIRGRSSRPLPDDPSAFVTANVCGRARPTRAPVSRLGEITCNRAGERRRPGFEFGRREELRRSSGQFDVLASACPALIRFGRISVSASGRSAA